MLFLCYTKTAVEMFIILHEKNFRDLRLITLAANSALNHNLLEHPSQLIPNKLCKILAW